MDNNKARFQMMEGYDESGKYIGHFEDMVAVDSRIYPSDDIIMVFGRCTHLCCIPGWQLVSNSYTDDTWTPGGTDDGGTKLFCICHSSRFDTTALEMNTNRNRSNGATFTYAGVRKSGGPAPVGLPLIPVELNNDAPEKQSPGLDEEIDIDISDDGDDKFIDIRTDKERAAEEGEEEEDPRDSFGIEGKDTTGRNMAYTTFKKIESQIIDAYDLLSNAEDQELFFDYLVANLKLYFDKFENEIQPNVEEPSNQAYDSAAKEEPAGGEEDAGETLDLEI